MENPKALYSGICHFKKYVENHFIYVELIWKTLFMLQTKRNQNVNPQLVHIVINKLSTKDSSLYKGLIFLMISIVLLSVSFSSISQILFLFTP